MSSSHTNAQARIETEQASKYLQQLCKHFQHKLPASFDATAGRIEFPAGHTRLAADAQALTISLQSANADDLARLKDVVARHLERFAFRETLQIEWREAAQ